MSASRLTLNALIWPSKARVTPVDRNVVSVVTDFEVGDVNVIETKFCVERRRKQP
jgi:hypothetical protein